MSSATKSPQSLPPLGPPAGQREADELRDFLETASLPMHWVGPDGIVLWANPAELELLGYTREEYVGHHIAEFHADVPLIEDILARLAHGERLREYPARLRAKDGSLRDVLIDSSVLFEDGKFVHTRCFTRDVTGHKRTQQALRDSEGRYRTLFDAAPMAVFVCDRDGVIQDYNHHAVELWGREPGRGVEKHCGSVKLWLPNGVHLPHNQSPVMEVMRSGVPTLNVEVLIERPDGSLLPVMVNFAPLKDARGEITGAITSFVDISERKRAEEGLRQREKRYRELVEALPVAVYTTDAEGHILLHNEAAAQLAGRRAEIGRDKWCVSHRLFRTDGSFLPHEECPMALALRTGKPVQSVETIAERPDGTRVRFIPYPTLLLDDGGAVVGAVNVLVDVTERRQAGEALRRAEKIAATGQLAASVAHEINNPLQALINLLALIAHHASDGNARQLTAMAQKEAARMGHITKQMLAFYRDTVTPVPVRITEVLEDALELWVSKVRDQRIKIERNYAVVEHVQAFPGELRQAFANLVGNSIDALPEGGTIRLRAFPSCDWKNPQRKGIRVVLADNGLGISREDKKRIFEPFYSTKGVKGAGLGLWVARGVIEAHQGSIHFRSSTEPGRSGTSFSIFLPENGFQRVAAGEAEGSASAA